jgi:YVTN family beta-propeller protein
MRFVEKIVLIPSNVFIRQATLVALLSVMGLLAACSPDSAEQAADEPAAAEAMEAETGKTAAVETAATDEQQVTKRITREGVVVEFSTKPTDPDKDTVMAADWADVTFRITDANTGEPIKGRYPAAWMDLSETWEARGEKVLTCDERVRTYLQGIVGVRPMIDLNSHFLLVLNADASISVIDPAVGITGITNLFAQINFDRPGADWAKTEDQKNIFVSMPLADQVALIDTETFKVVKNIDAGYEPTRAELQNDERYLWIGNNTLESHHSGVTVIDTAAHEKLAFIETGKGHHEIAFTDDDRYAFVSNRDSGTVSVIDVQSLKKVKDIETGPVPIALAFSPLGGALYVADGKAGTVTVVDTGSLEVRSRMQAKPGLGPIRFSEDGRWGLVVNPFENEVIVIDASSDELAHTLKVGSKPYQVTFTRSFGYVRSLGTQDVALIPVSELDGDETPPVTYIPAGQNPPGVAAQISIADAMIPSVKQAASYIVNQADGTVHYYMEGMAAPMGAFRNYGHQARAIEIVDRSLGEVDPGVYVGRVKIPFEGIYDIAFMMDTPRFLHCFSAEVAPNPDFAPTKARMAIEYETTERNVPVGTEATVRFQLIDPRTGLPVMDIADMQVLYYRSDGRGRTRVPATPTKDGFYEATVRLDKLATYYIYVGANSIGLNYSDLPFFSMWTKPAEAGDKVPAGQAKTTEG